MNHLLRPLTSPAALHVWLLILRIAVAGFMLTHGIPKLMNVLNGNWDFGDPLGMGTRTSLVLAIFAEVGCSILILLGLFTRFATLPLLITMLVAIFVVHAADPLGEKELAILYALLFATLFFTGPGKYSIDGRRGDL